MNIELKTTSRRWYCEYYTTDFSGEKIRHRDYGQHLKVNRCRDKQERLKLLMLLRSDILRKFINAPPGNSVAGRIAFIVKRKKLYQRKRSQASTATAIRSFIAFLCEYNLDLLRPDQITQDHIKDFIKWSMARGICNRSVNNYMIDVSAVFNDMLSSEIILKNPCRKIKKLPTESENHTAFTDEQMTLIKGWMETNDPYLSLFCKFVGYCFLRIDELRLLQVRHIDLTGGFIHVPAAITKTGTSQKKKLLKIFMPVIAEMNLQKYDLDDYIFSIEHKPGPVKVGINYFRKRFKLMKDDLNLPAKNTMYGIRHTMISNLIANGAPHWDVMKLTGHRTLDAFEKYLRSIKATEMADLSEVFSVAI